MSSPWAPQTWTNNKEICESITWLIMFSGKIIYLISQEDVVVWITGMLMMWYNTIKGKTDQGRRLHK